MNAAALFSIPSLVALLFLCSCKAQAVSEPREAAPGIFQVGLIRSEALTEGSGIVTASETNRFWTHNDGSVPVLFAIDRTGMTINQFRINGVTVTDWEDIARDTSGNLYLADTGNNNRHRTELAVHRFAEPDPARTNGNIQVSRSWVLKFPEQPFDCESLIISHEHGYVISKVTKDRRAGLYRFALAETNCILEFVTELPVTSPVTAADVSPDGKTLGLVCKSGAYLFEINGEVARAGIVPPRFAPFREGQIEGCCFVPEGLLAISEKREIFLFEPRAFRPK